MRIPKIIDDPYLSDLAAKIRTFPPDEASVFLFEAGSLVLLAGYPEIAYKLFTNLLTGELKIIEKSSLANPLKAILPSLCYAMGISCPAIFSEKELSIPELEQYIFENFRKYERSSSINKSFAEVPLGDWSEDFLYEITHPTVDITGNERFKIYAFLQDLYRIIAVRCLSQRKFEDADKYLRIFEDVLKAWEIDYKSYTHQEMLIFGIRTYFGLNDITNANKYIVKWWKSLEVLERAVYLLAYLPDLIKRILEGVLQNEIKISETQAQEFLNSVNNRTYNPDQIGFIPTVDDWKVFLERWNREVFEKTDEDYRESYERYYPEALESKQCLREGATEAQIIELEEKLKTKLPLSYRNFLLASNGFIILNNYCELSRTEQINWFIEENGYMTEGWDSNDDDITDEEYFQYGEHQDCCSMKGKYLKTALQISSTEDGDVYLLNPQIIDARNEWEAWDFGCKNPGAYRYRSFWDIMQQIYKRSLND
jgi:hypothetical protein